MTPARQMAIHSFAWLVGIPVLLIAGWFAWFYFDVYVIHPRIPDRYLIPKGYVGNVRIEFSVPKAPKLAIVEHHRIFPVNADGTLRTSSRYEDSYRREGRGWAHDEYYYVDGEHRTALKDCAWCDQEMIWERSFRYQGNAPTAQNFAESETFFLGTKADFCNLDKDRIYKICR